MMPSDATRYNKCNQNNFDNMYCRAAAIFWQFEVSVLTSSAWWQKYEIKF